jgi:hypothetical protein
MTRDRLSSLVFVAGALLAGGLFFSNLDRLWPPLPADLTYDRRAIETEARRRLESLDVSVANYGAAVAIEVDEPMVDYLDSAFVRREAGRFAVKGGAAKYRIVFKRADEPNAIRMALDPYLRPLSLFIERDEDEPGASLHVESAAIIALGAARQVFALDDAWPDSTWRRFSSGSSDLASRRDHGFAFERTISDTPELKERISIGVYGDSVGSLARGLVPPPAVERFERVGRAPVSNLETIGWLLLGLGTAAAFLIFLRELRSGRASIAGPATLSALVVLLLWASYPFRRVWLMDAWDPLWPFASSAFRTLGFAMLSDLPKWVGLFVFIAAADALDRAAGFGRGDALRKLVTGRLRDRRIPLASARGFLVGLLCGGALTVVVMLLERFAGARVALQPRGFFLYSMNSSLPALSIAVFFLHTALLEELGYRAFAGTWILKSTRSRALAVFLPAIVYGLTHAGFEFLPPAEPFWARALALACVGAVWGWAFLRFDALTVIVSHYTADLVIFTGPWLASTCVRHQLMAVGLILLPLLPAFLFLLPRIPSKPLEP